jgi:hypothetical protein
MAISILILVKEAAEDNERHPGLLVLGDNTSAISWIFRSGRVARSSKYYGAVKMIARHIAHSTLKSEAQVCPQHLAGATNTVADLLSFEGACRSKNRSVWFRNSPVAGRDRVLRSLCDANRCEVMDSKGEASQERGDRHLRRWKAFLRDWGLGSDPWFDSVPDDQERLLLARGFVMRHRAFNFDAQGRASTKRPRPMVSSTIRDAISGVASTFRQRGRASPFHLPHRVNDSGSMHPRIRALIKGFERDDPPPKRQKAATPALLRDMYAMAQTMLKWAKQAADLILGGGYFFAMRACEFCLTERPGRTKRLTTANVAFRDKKSRLVKLKDPAFRQKQCL